MQRLFVRHQRCHHHDHHHRPCLLLAKFEHYFFNLNCGTCPLFELLIPQFVCMSTAECVSVLKRLVCCFPLTNGNHRATTAATTVRSQLRRDLAAAMLHLAISRSRWKPLFAFVCCRCLPLGARYSPFGVQFAPPCARLPWDSQHVARLLLVQISHRATYEQNQFRNPNSTAFDGILKTKKTTISFLILLVI